MNFRVRGTVSGLNRTVSPSSAKDVQAERFHRRRDVLRFSMTWANITRSSVLIVRSVRIVVPTGRK